ncbi:MAG: hypothetical protein U5N86_09840 [Planctomycetota bacterium]|nr:hypothetical protein [Planctomycetota bacterium]
MSELERDRACADKSATDVNFGSRRGRCYRGRALNTAAQYDKG